MSEVVWSWHPRWWSIEKCCDAIIEGPKVEEIDGHIWDLRGIVFYELKRLGKFDEEAEGPENHEYVNKIMRELMERL